MKSQVLTDRSSNVLSPLDDAHHTHKNTSTPKPENGDLSTLSAKKKRRNLPPLSGFTDEELGFCDFASPIRSSPVVPKRCRVSNKKISTPMDISPHPARNQSNSLQQMSSISLVSGIGTFMPRETLNSTSSFQISTETEMSIKSTSIAAATMPLIPEKEGKSESITTKPESELSKLDDEKSQILRGVVAYVDVRTYTNNQSRPVAKEMERLGAVVVQRLNKKVTHVIFSDGRWSTYRRARELGLTIVNMLWIGACKAKGEKVDECSYPPEVDDSTPKYRFNRAPSMEPKPPEEEEERRLRREKRRNKKSKVQILREQLAAMERDDSPSVYDVLRTEIGPLQRMREARLKAGLSVSTIDSILEKARPHAGPIESPPSQPGSQRVRGCLFGTSELEKLPEDSQEESKEGRISTDAAPLSPPHPAAAELPSPPKPKRRKLLSIVGDNYDALELPTKPSQSQPQTQPLSQLVGSSSQFKPKPKTQPLSQLVATSSQAPSHPSQSQSQALFSQCSTAYTQSDAGLVPRLPMPRPSSQEFRPLKRPVAKKMAATPLRTIVLTSVHQNDREAMHSIIRTLGDVQIDTKVRDRTTHIICGDDRRTLTVLMGIVRGCWLLEKEWVYRSLECGYWLPESDFELAKQFPAAKENRVHRQAEGNLFVLDLFSELPSMFVSPSACPPPDKLRDLLILSSAKVTNNFRRAGIIIGPFSPSTQTETSFTHVSEKWILDCICRREVVDMTRYLVR